MSSYETVRKAMRSNDLTWRFLFNLSPTLRYFVDGSKGLTEAEKGILTQLRSDGVAITSVNALFGSESLLEQLVAETKRLLTEKREAIELLRSSANESSIGNKTFNFEILGSEPLFDPDCVYSRFALNEVLLKLANSYFQMCVKLRYYNVWSTFASNGESRESQLWHVDREDVRILKVFLYLNDVDIGTGPFTYAAGTQKQGRNRHLKPDSFIEGGVRRTTDAQMSRVLPESDWIRCTGKKGTLVLADTAGYHKGGEARTKDRLMYTCMYTSPASESKPLLRYPPTLDAEVLGSQQKRALQVSPR